MTKVFPTRADRAKLLSAFAFAVALMLAAGTGSLPVSAQSKSNAATKKNSAAAKKSPSKSTRRPGARASRSRAQSAPTPDRIREIQGALAQAGTYAGEPTGKWDAATTSAMQKFQESHNLKPTGKLDAITLQKLGLGSPVAGLAPPVKTAASGGSNR